MNPSIHAMQANRSEFPALVQTARTSFPVRIAYAEFCAKAGNESPTQAIAVKTGLGMIPLL
jgi:hypothetical protein